MTKTTYTHAEWLAEGKRRFGDDFMKWRFQCPACGHIASVQDIKDAGGDPETQSYFCCIGRFTGQGAPDRKHNEKGCNWTAGGLFGTMGKGVTIITPDGKEHDVFDFAPMEEDYGKETE